jgi:hypothetical protein
MRVTPRVSAWPWPRNQRERDPSVKTWATAGTSCGTRSARSHAADTRGYLLSPPEENTAEKRRGNDETPRGTNDPTSGRRPKYPQAVAVSGFSLPRESSESRRCVPTELSYRFEQWSPVSFTPRFVAVYDDAHEWRDFVASAAVGDVFLAGPVGRHCERSGVCSDGRSDLTQEDRKMA